MSESLFTSLCDELRELFAPFVRAATDDRRWRLLVTDLGVDPEHANRASFATSLDAFVDLANELERLAEHPTPSLDGITALLDASRRAFAGVRALDGTGTGLGRDLVQLLVAIYLRRMHPLAFGIMALLGLVDEGYADHRRIVVDRFHFERVGPLLRDPRAVLRDAYGGFPETVDDANALSDKLFRRIASTLRILGVSAQYGFLEDDRASLGDAAPLVDHALIVYATETLAGASADAGAVLQWSPKQRGELGLVVTPFGELSLTRNVDRWALELAVGAGVRAFAIGPKGHFINTDAGVTGVDARFSATLPPADDGVAATIGAANGTRLEVNGARFATKLAIAGDRRSFEIAAAIDKAALVIAAGDGDGFVRAILPASGIRAPFDLGIGWSSDRGLSLHGGIGLDTTQPLALAIGPVRLESIRLQLTGSNAGVRASIGTALALRLGPADVVVDGTGLVSTLSFPDRDGNFGIADVDLDFQPPSGVRLGLAVGPVTGSGALAFESGRYSGALSLAIGELFAVDMVGVIETRRPDGRDGFSMIFSGAATFPGIPVGFGFELHRAGAVFGMHRRLDVPALQAALVDGRIASLLSPPHDASPQTLVAQLGHVLPFAQDAYVGGVTLGFRWGHPTIVNIDLGILYDSSTPAQLVAIGTVAAQLPDDHPLIEINVDAVGVVRFAPLWIDLRARLRESKLAGMPLVGEAALQFGLGGSPRFLLSLGGFHSGFTPPADFPKLQRLALSLPANDYVELSLSGFFAMTASTLQFGADLHFWAGIDGLLGIEGDARFEALLSWRPVHFDAALDVHVAVKVADTTLFGASLHGRLSGPGPWHVRGGVYITVLSYDVEVYSVDASFGSDLLPGGLPAFDVIAALIEALHVPRNWRSDPPRDARGIATAATDDESAIRVHPLGELEVTQSILPLGVKIDRVGGARPSSSTQVSLAQPRLGGVDAEATRVDGFFAPGQFFDLDEAARLSQPSFQQLQAGLRIKPAAGPDLTPYATYSSIRYETIPAPPQPIQPWTPFSVLDGVLAEQGSRQPARRWVEPAAGARAVKLRERRFDIASTETLAVDGALTPSGGFASRAEAHQAMRTAVAANPARASLLQVVERAA